MTYAEFKETIVAYMQEKLGPNVKVALQDIVKNNDTHLDGLTVFSDQTNISPTIYLNYYFKQYEKGAPIEEICEDVYQVYSNSKPKSNIDVSFFTQFEKVKERIVFKLVNFQKNQAMLANIPYIRFLDLAIIFNCLVEADSEGSATILIQNQHLALWHINKNDLYEIAKENTPKLLSYDITSMGEILNKVLFGDEDDSPLPLCDSPVPMYVLSNHHRFNGSGCILYKGLLQTLAQKLCSSFYILPSSIHEVLLIPTTKTSASTLEFTSIVQDVNKTHLANEEYLSDSVYYYCMETDTVTM